MNETRLIEVTDRRYVVAGLTLLLAAAVLFAGAAMPVAATHNDTSWMDGVVDTATEDDSMTPDVDALTAGVSGLVDRVTHSASTAISGPDTDAGTAAGELQAEYNNHSTTYEDWAAANAPAPEDTEHDTLQIDVTVGEDTETMYLVGDVTENSDGELEYRNTQIVNSTEREVDETVELDGAAAENAADELTGLRESHIEPGEPLTRDDPEIIRLAAQYEGDITTTLA